ncbi:MAG: Aryldialkylphosphatase, partial [Bacteroidota bacterium]|nr:Aryldialkylphosphatase [Bacteroidota bacterium]
MKQDDYYDLKIILWLILFLVFGIVIITCKPAVNDYVMTVNGPENPGKLGITLEHEHILVDFIGADSTGYFRWNRDSVIEKILPLVLEAKRKGVKTFIDCTPAFLGRDPWLLKKLSGKSGMIFITNTGYYGSGKNKYIPGSFYNENSETIAAKWISEFENGIEKSRVKPGFIKIAVENDSVISQEHRKIVVAAGLTHLKTGMVIASHTGPEHLAFEQLESLRELGVNPSSFIWVHAQRGTMKGVIDAARQGAWISFDNFRHRPSLEPGSTYSTEWYADRILEMRDNGLLNKVLLSHDSGWYQPGKPGGGKINGYTDIFDYLIPELKRRGFTAADIDQIMSKNPAEAFKINIRRTPSP